MPLTDDPRLRRVLRQHVDTDRLLGLDAVPLAPAPGSAPGSGVQPTDATADPSPAATAPATASAGVTPSAAPPPTSLLDAVERPADAPAEQLTGDRKLQVLAAMDRDEVRGCTKCPLHQGRTQTVFGEGSPDADVMFIGEGPGQTEDETGRPFVGRAGELLTKMIEAMGYRREDVYIANVVKCRPPGNRTPTPPEVQTCWDYLRRQIQTIRPKAIVTVGGPATKMVLETDTGITRLRGTWHQYHGINPPIPVMPTFHPAYLLRSYTRENRAKVWSDLQAVMQRIGKDRTSNA